MENKKVKYGFTLVELLVVISIIALLLALLVPALSKAREQAKSTICKARMKQFGTALQLYADTNNGLYVTHDWDGGPGAWFTRLHKYLGALKNNPEKMTTFMRCPSGRAIKDFGDTPNYAYNAFDYALQAFNGGNNSATRAASDPLVYTPWKIVNIKQCANFGAVFDFYFGELSLIPLGFPKGYLPDVEGITTGVRWYMVLYQYSLSKSMFQSRVFRHKGINAGYVDGHVGHIAYKRVCKISEGPKWTQISGNTPTDNFVRPDWWLDLATPSSLGWNTSGPGKYPWAR